MSGHLTRHRSLRFSSATYSVQPESGCTPPVVARSRQRCRLHGASARGVQANRPRDPRPHGQRVKSIVGSCLTNRSSRDRFVAAPPCGTLSRRRGHKTARLNSGVSPQKKWFSAKSFFFFAKAKELLCPTLARALAYLGPDTPPPGGTSLGFKPKPIIQAFGGNSRLQWANNSFKPTPLRGVVVAFSHPPSPAPAPPRCGAA